MHFNILMNRVLMFQGSEIEDEYVFIKFILKTFTQDLSKFAKQDHSFQVFYLNDQIQAAAEQYQSVKLIMAYSVGRNLFKVKGNMCLMLVIALLALGQSENITYAPPPAINITQLVQLNNSAQESRFIGSKRLQNLEIIQSGGTTSFVMTYFNRSSSNFTNKYTIANEPGTWTYLKGTQETLSCSLIYETSTSAYGLLQFINDLGVFNIIAKVPFATLNAFYSTTLGITSNYSSMADQFIPGENCQVGMLFNSVFHLKDALDYSIIVIPSGWKVEAYTQSFQYGVTNSNLYSLNKTTSMYNLIYPLDKFQTFRIKEYQGRIIITGANGTNNTNGTNSFIQKIYFFEDSVTGFTPISTITLNGTSFSQNYIPIFTSPQLTKMGYSYIPAGSNASLQIFAKSIDYLNKKVIDLVFSDPLHAYQTFNSVQSNEFDFSDYFLVVRNASKLAYNNSLTAFEEAYQFMGNQIIYYASRQLNSSQETNDWVSVYVDLYFSSTLVALDVYRTSSGRSVYQVEYGNYGDTKKIIPTEIAPFIKFAEPTNTFKQPLNPFNFTWAYYDTSTPQLTKVFFYRINPFSPGTHLDSYNQNIPITFQYVARSTNCRIFLQPTTTTYVLFKFDPSQSDPTIPYNINQQISGLGIDGSEQWYVSEKCDKFAVKGRVFYLNGDSFALTSNNYSTFAWSSADATNITYVVSNGNIWKYDASLHKYVQYTTNASINSLSTIAVYQNRILITATNSTNASSTINVQILAFIDVSSILTPVFTYNNVFTTIPAFDYSQKLTKVVVAGMIGNKTNVEAFYIDYNGRTNISINFPMQTVSVLAFTEILIFQDFFYVRQLYDFSQQNNTSYNAINRQEFAYYLSQNYFPQLLLQRNLTVDQARTWKKSLIVTDNGVDFYLATESLERNNSVNYVVVRVTQLNVGKSNLNSGNNQAISGFVMNGAIYLCTPGCSDCSTLICTGCKTGFAFNGNSALCVPCAIGCLTCLSSNPLNCSSCANGTYLSGSTCLPCNSNCITCNNTANSCLNCRTGQFYSSGAGQCMFCPRNCLACSNDVTCTQCNKGFTLTASNTCRGCVLSCSDCSPSDITQCTACANGLQLINSKCVPCPNYCLTCNNGLCQNCIPGYFPNTVGTCVPNCQLPCAKCVDFQPTYCTSCFSSAILSSGTCVFSANCNTTGTCTDCGQALGYFLLNQYCYPCSQINSVSNCLQCSQANQQICSICKDGYYLDSTGSCPACTAPCSNCIGSTLCTSCQLGYTLPLDQSQGQCLKCISPCETCYGSPTYCMTCLSGFTKNAWKCQKNTYISFTVTLAGLRATFLASPDSLIVFFLTLLGQNSTNVDAITLQTIQTGSVIVSGTANPSNGNYASAATNLQAGLSNGASAGNFTVVSSSVGVVSNTNSPSSSSPNVGLIVGLTVGLIGFAIILTLIVLICRKSKVHSLQTSQVISIKEGSYNEKASQQMPNPHTHLTNSQKNIDQQ